MERRLTAILAADVVGYSRLMRADETGTLAGLRAHREQLFDPKIAEHGGHIVKTMGDGLLVEFPSVVHALQCAVEVQRGMLARNVNVSEDERIQFRIGVNIGDVIIEDGDIHGDGVNIASRLEGLAEPGGICVRRAVRNEVRDKLPLFFEDMGAIEVKNIARPLRVFRVLLDENVAPGGTTRPAGRSAKRGSVLLALTAFVLTVIAGGLVWWQLFQPAELGAPPVGAVPPLPDRPSIAVLPFHNVGGEPEQEYFADGITDDLITDLSKLSGLFVISRNSAFTYKGEPVHIPDVARELGVRYVLEGSVRRHGETIRVNAQLIDGATGGHLWAERYDGALDNIFALQDRVISEIVSQLKIKLTSAEEAQLARIPTGDLEAYDNYLRAEREGYYVADAARLQRTLAFYRKAIELDPDFAEAHAGYARALIEVMRLGFDNLLPSTVARRAAYEAAGRALSLDGGNARAYSVLAFLQALDSRHSEAISSARKAVSLSPGNAEVKTDLGLMLAYAGRTREAVTEVEAALRLNPKPLPGVSLIAAVVFYFDRQYQRAIALLEPVRREQPRSEAALEFLAASFAHLGELDRARTLLKSLLDLYPPLNLSYFRLRYQHVRRTSDVDHHLMGLEKAGLTSWPFGYQAPAKDRLTGAAIESVTLGKLWRGTRHNGVAFMQDNSAEGTFAYSSTLGLTTGSLWVEGDQLCQRVEGHLFGRAVCGYVYRNWDSASEDNHRYVYVAPDSVRYFSVAN